MAFLDTGTATAPAGTAYIQSFTLYVDFTGNFQGVYFDDAGLEVLAASTPIGLLVVTYRPRLFQIMTRSGF